MFQGCVIAEIQKHGKSRETAPSMVDSFRKMIDSMLRLREI
jgi:hypothetical protein